MDETTTTAQDLFLARRLRVTNQGSVPVHVGYLDDDGQQHALATLAPGESRLLSEQRPLYAWTDGGQARVQYSR